MPARIVFAVLFGATLAACAAAGPPPELGREVAVRRHLSDGEEFNLSLPALLAHGRALFAANWTSQEGSGRPLTKGTGAPLADRTAPLTFPRAFNRVSGPDANACAGCHNAPFGLIGGGGDVVTNVFVLAQRFDFVTFDGRDATRTGGLFDERPRTTTLDSVGNSRRTVGLSGAGYIEMLARQMTADLRAIRDRIGPGESRVLETKGVAFGVLARNRDGSWNTAGVTGLPATSIVATIPDHPPTLIVRPFSQAGNVISLRQFTVNAFNHHHGIQATERFGRDVDPDQDGFKNELSVADVTAATLFQAALPAPGRVIARIPAIERAVRQGEELFRTIGCAACHVPALPLDARGWVYTEPNPFNPGGTISRGWKIEMDLTDASLPGPRIAAGTDGVVWVPAFTDLKLHDITGGPDDPNREPLDMNEPGGTAAFYAGNAKFLTRKLWDAGNSPPYFHHGQYTTLREAIEAHRGEAQAAFEAWRRLADAERDAVIEFLKSLQVLPPGTTHRIVDERGRKRAWDAPYPSATARRPDP